MYSFDREKIDWSKTADQIGFSLAWLLTRKDDFSHDGGKH